MNHHTSNVRRILPNRNTRHLRLGALAIALALALPAAKAAPATIDWLSYAPTPTTGNVPPAQNLFIYTSAGYNPYGPVSLSYTAVTPGMVTGVSLPGTMQNGSIASNTYNWGNVENFGRTGTNPNDPINQHWSVTYTFSIPMQAGQSLILGIGGLGRRDPNPGEANIGLASIVNVSSPGSFTLLGEYDNSAQFAPTLSTIVNGLSGSLTAENSVSAPGGQNPNWNTKWAVYEYTALRTVSSLTFSVDQTNGDGLGMSIGFLNPVPEPQTLGLMACGLALMGLRLRRQSRLDRD
jgi:hypothetical protein